MKQKSNIGKIFLLLRIVATVIIGTMIDNDVSILSYVIFLDSIIGAFLFSVFFFIIPAIFSISINNFVAWILYSFVFGIFIWYRFGHDLLNIKNSNAWLIWYFFIFLTSRGWTFLYTIMYFLLFFILGI